MRDWAEMGRMGMGSPPPAARRPPGPPRRAMSGLPLRGVIRRRPWNGWPVPESTPSQRLASESLELPVVQFVLRLPRRVARSRSDSPPRADPDAVPSRKYSPDSESDPFAERKNGLGGSSADGVHEWARGEVEAAPNESWDVRRGASTVEERSSSSRAHSTEQNRPELCCGCSGGRVAVLGFWGESGLDDEGVGVVGLDSAVTATSAAGAGAPLACSPAEEVLLMVPVPDRWTAAGCGGGLAGTTVVLACGRAGSHVQSMAGRRRQIEIAGCDNRGG